MPSATSTLQFASAISSLPRTGEALAAITQRVGEQMDGAAIDLLLVSFTYHHRDAAEQIASHLQDALQPGKQIGCTACGVLADGRECEHMPAIAVMAARLPGIQVRAFDDVALDWPANRENPAALRQCVLGGPAGRATSDNPDESSLVVMLADPFSLPMIHLLPTLDDALDNVPIVGGMASGATRPDENRLILNDQVRSGGAVGVSLQGPVAMDCVVSQGCRPIGPTYVITRARHNLIQQLGRRPVIEVVRELADSLDHENRQLLKHGLLVGRVIDEYKDRFGRGDFLIRNIVGMDQEHGYIAVSDLVRVGQTIQFHVRDRQTAEEDLSLLLAAQRLKGPAAGAMLFTCNGRGRAMFDQPHFESQMIVQSLGDIPIGGLFAAGELGPIGHASFIHGFTASLVLFRDGGAS
jgi:small ligand-binding sensory domain FIST